MSFKSRDLMAGVLPADKLFACGDVTKAQGGQCVDPTKPPQIVESELSFAELRDQLRAALAEQAGV